MSYDPTSLEGVPEAGRERLRRMRETGGRFFTSDLSVNEFLLVKQAGFEPLGLVVGSSIYHIGLQLRRWGKNQELDVLTQAMYHARELAMTRMEEEADSLAADGVVGVRLEVGRHEWGGELAEFIAIGTAVKHAGGELHRAPNGRPFTSDLSGQDFWTLLSAGYRPVGLVLGNCVYHVAHQNVGTWAGRVGRQSRDAELHAGASTTRASWRCHACRRRPRRSRRRASSASTCTSGSHGWGAHVIEFIAIGTAIVPTKADHEIATPALVLTLNDPPPSLK